MRPADDRRGFLKRLGGWLAFGGLIGGVGMLVARRPEAPAGPGETCVNDGLCRGCAAYAGCRLPTALSMKQALGGGTGR